MRERQGGRAFDPRKVATYGFIAAMVLAPFLALAFDPNAGLAVMTAALAATTYLVLDAARHTAPRLRPRLLSVAALNAGLTLVCLVVLLLRLT